MASGSARGPEPLAGAPLEQRVTVVASVWRACHSGEVWRDACLGQLLHSRARTALVQQRRLCGDDMQGAPGPKRPQRRNSATVQRRGGPAADAAVGEGKQSGPLMLLHPQHTYNGGGEVEARGARGPSRYTSDSQEEGRGWKLARTVQAHILRVPVPQTPIHPERRGASRRLLHL